MPKYSLPRTTSLRSLRLKLSRKLLASLSVAALVFSLAPLSSSALTVDELLGQSGGVSSNTTSIYPSITVTSASNTSLLLKVTPLSFNGANWTYQITWHRTLATTGSVYVTLKSDKTQQIYSSDPAAQNDNGSQTMTLAPSTAYRIEFWQQPSLGGILLLRKFFTTLPSTAATTNTTTTTNSQSSTNAPSVASQLAANPNGPANCFSANWPAVEQNYDSIVSKKLNDILTARYGPTLTNVNGLSALNGNDINWVQLGCSASSDDFNHGLVTAPGANVNHPLGLASYTRKGDDPVDTPQRYDIYMYYCGAANYQSPGFVDGSTSSAFTNPPTSGLCANGATASTPVLSLQNEAIPWFSISQADLGTAGWVHWDWTCTGPNRPASATKYQGYPGASTDKMGNPLPDSVAASMKAYSDWLDNKNGSFSHCAAPVNIVDTKYCGPDLGQDFGSSPLPTKGLCANGATASQVAIEGDKNSGQAAWICTGPDYASSCHTQYKTIGNSANGGTSVTDPVPDPVCSYSPDQQKSLCLSQNYWCYNSDVCSGSIPLTTIKDTSIPSSPVYTPANTNVGIGSGR